MGSNIAPEESVWRELVAAFGEKRAAEIMGDTTPPARRKPVPTRVGVPDKPLPALTRSGPTGNPGWRELRDLDVLQGVRNPVKGVRIRTMAKARKCAGCSNEIVPGEEAMYVMRVGGINRWYCMACGHREVARG